MSLSRNDRARLAAVHRWARGRGWQADVYPGAWRSHHDLTRVRLEVDELVVEWFMVPYGEPRTARVPVWTVGHAIDVLVGLHVLPPEFSRAYQVGRADADWREPMRKVLAAALDTLAVAGP